MIQAFEPMSLPHLTISNRICRSATNDYIGNHDGTVSDAQIKRYEALARGGVGLIFTGHACVSAGGRNDPCQNAMYSDHFIESQRRLTDIVHQNGGKIVQQINHSGGKSQRSAITNMPVAPSHMEYVPGVCADALTIDQLLEIEDMFAQAAGRAKMAGYDGVQVHCAHGYLFSEFLDPAWNHRTDTYGGAWENRFRIVRETLEKVRSAVGPEYPLFLKIHTNAVQDDAQFANDLAHMLNSILHIKLEAVELSGHDFATKKPTERLYYLERAACIAQTVKTPVILAGGVRTLDDIDRALALGIAMVSMARPFICQPDILQILQNRGKSQCRNCFGCFTCYQKTGKHCVMH